MINEIEFNNKKYPRFEAESFGARYVFSFAQHVCSGIGYDIGCAKREWAFPGSIPIDIVFNDGFDAMNLPDTKVDYIFSSHCLEHLDHWVDALNYWISKVKSQGVIFLYLPHFDQEYWRPWNNPRHKHCLDSLTITTMLESTKKVHKIYHSERDINHSFVVMCEII
jgi:predicted SAM-dependent methyltransferase